ncbi:hypothetical protein R1sor_010846 [Riccia sorocarpa]|uniref:ubiquitinyl hydrolase 1 n=1 Tax=Riccia sorocarpa TaxID=122646 RepID=A0ABD3I325_9MARC
MRRSSSTREQKTHYGLSNRGGALVRAKSLREHLQMADEDEGVEDASNPASAAVRKIYHERQRLQLCLLHALNNLLQGENAFTRKELDEIADKLPTMIEGGDRWRPLSMIFKRHRNSFTGDYDVNVLIAALASRGKEVIWYDRRKGVDGFNVEGYGGRLAGIIVNVPSRKFMNMWKGRHWIALRVINGRWYNLDSDFESPRAFDQGRGDLKKYLESVFAETGEVLIIVEGAPRSMLQ